jgi:hypothetical protein
LENNIDFAVKLVKSFNSKIKLLEGTDEFAKLTELGQFITKEVIVSTLSKSDEKYCKLLEFSLKLVHRIKKHTPKVKDDVNFVEVLETMIEKFEINSYLVSMYIKLMALTIDASDPEQISKIGKIFKKHAYADQKEQVRVANVKSVTKVLEKLDLEKNSSHCLDIIMSIILILNDEHPEIRSYFV